MNRRNIIKGILGFLGLGSAALAENLQPKKNIENAVYNRFRLGEKTYYAMNGEVYLSCENNIKTYWKNGKIHRDNNLPAVIYKDGSKEWYCKGKRHRENGPAVVYSNGNKEYWINGKRHRIDGPAIENHEFKAWFFDGKIHRDNLPAIERINGHNEYWCQGIRKNDEWLMNS
ncbi:MAG: hypothetical protein EKK64_06585 [Neisseriaceae bacterium]|nr:MAG: hypothetical protein EKK64_06585 [Neisseriaceae bacterium]